MYHIIVNPTAGRGQAMARVPVLSKFFDNHHIAYKVLQTTAPRDAIDKVKHITAEGSQGIIGIGGDGTIQEIIAGLANAQNNAINIPLAILPCGSGNDFVLTLSKHPPSTEAIMNAIIKNRTRRVDIIRANDMAYLNIGNIGLDARIVQRAITLKERYGRYAYLAAVYKCIARHENLPLTIEIDGVTHENKYTLVAVCNGQYYGGGMCIAPHAKIDDGRITLVLAEAMSRLKTMLIFPTLLVKLHGRLNAVSFTTCKKLTITLPHPETLCLDGNLYNTSGAITFTIQPKGLSLFI